MIYIILFKNCIISCESDKENHEVFMKYNMWIYVQQSEKMIYNDINTCAFWFQSEMCF